MESASLTRAHEHVRNAATATYSNSVSTAGDEHASAASAFREAAHDTHNAEALRILGLLEDHHLKLARLIKEPPRNRDKKRDVAAAPAEKTASPPAKAPPARTASPSTSSPTRAPSRRRLPQSSIASNLAEKRGIPGARRATPTAAPVSVTNALATRHEQNATPVRHLLQQQSKKAEEASREKDESTTSAKQPPQARPVAPAPDEGFRRFYSAFGGMLNTIAAPLAFTSLPLNPLNAPGTSDSSTTQTSPTKEKEKDQAKAVPKDTAKAPSSRTTSPSASRTIKSSEPDLASLISKPALHALRSDHSSPLGPLANNESFYFVPTSGGTLSYANILRDPNAQPHPHLDSIAETDSDLPNPNSNSGTNLRGSSHEEFVDARESLPPDSPTSSRRPRSRSGDPNSQSTKGKTKGTPTTSLNLTTAQSIRAGSGRGLRSMEELALENETLRALIDKQAKRLSMWETTSQSSYNALAQSLRARGTTTTTTSPSAIPNPISPPRTQTSDPTHLAQALVPKTPTNTNTNTTNTTSPTTPQPPNPQTQSQSQSQITALESQLAALHTTNAQLAKQNEKHALVIARYREQWEKLKAGARKKEEERRVRRGAGEGAAGGAERAAGEVEAAAEGGADGKGKGKGKGGGEKDGDGEEGVVGGDAGGEEELVDEEAFGKA